MRISTYLYLAVAFLFWQCSGNLQGPTPQPVPTPPVTNVNYDQTNIQLMADLAPKIVGQWTLRLVQVKRQPYNNNQKELNILKDTTLTNLATLTIKPVAVPRSSPRDLRRGEYEGTIQYNGKTYPIGFDMLANPEWVYTRKGPQTFFLFDYYFPNGTHQREQQEIVLENLGIVGDNFGLEIGSVPDQMTWRGLNRGVERIELVKSN